MGCRVVEVVVTLLAALGLGLAASPIVDWEFGKDVPGSIVVFEKTGAIRFWNKVVEVPIKVSPCMEIVYVHVQVQNAVSNPVVTYRKDTNTVRIEYGLLQSSKSWYEVTAKGVPICHEFVGRVNPLRHCTVVGCNPQSYTDVEYQGSYRQPDYPDYYPNPNDGLPDYYPNFKYPDSSNQHRNSFSRYRDPSKRMPDYPNSRYPDWGINHNGNRDSRYKDPSNRNRRPYPDSIYSEYGNPQLIFPDSMYPDKAPSRGKPWYPDTGADDPNGIIVPVPRLVDPNYKYSNDRQRPLVVIPDTQIQNQITCTNCLQPKKLRS